MWPIVRRINDLEPKLAGLSDASLQEKTFEFKNRLANGETLDDILPEAFAVVREASRRVTGMRHFDVQLLGGIVLHRGDIAEMRTGEGKTLVATLPVYLNALTGKASTSSPSMTTWLLVTVKTWAVSISSSVCLSASSSTTSRMTSAAGHTTPTSRMGRTMNSASTTCAITWSSVPTRWYSGRSIIVSSTKWIDPHRRSADAAHHFRPG